MNTRRILRSIIGSIKRLLLRTNSTVSYLTMSLTRRQALCVGRPRLQGNCLILLLSVHISLSKTNFLLARGFLESLSHWPNFKEKCMTLRFLKMIRSVIQKSCIVDDCIARLKTKKYYCSDENLVVVNNYCNGCWLGLRVLA